MEPEFTKNGQEIETKALNHPKWPPDGGREMSGPITGVTFFDFLSNLGYPPETQNPPKMHIFWKMGVRRQGFRQFFGDFCFFTRLRTISG